MESVDDEWDRDPDIIDVEDLLFVTYDADKMKREQILESIQKEGYSVNSLHITEVVDLRSTAIPAKLGGMYRFARHWVFARIRKEAQL